MEREHGAARRLQRAELGQRRRQDDLGIEACGDAAWPRGRRGRRGRRRAWPALPARPWPGASRPKRCRPAAGREPSPPAPRSAPTLTDRAIHPVASSSASAEAATAEPIAARSSPGAAFTWSARARISATSAEHRLAAVLGDLAADQVARLDAVGAFVDRQDARVAEMLRGAGLLDEAHAAMDLHADRGDLDAEVGAPRLDDRDQQIDAVLACVRAVACRDASARRRCRLPCSSPARASPRSARAWSSACAARRGDG